MSAGRWLEPPGNRGPRGMTVAEREFRYRTRLTGQLRLNSSARHAVIARARPLRGLDVADLLHHPIRREIVHAAEVPERALALIARTARQVLHAHDARHFGERRRVLGARRS